MADDLKNLGIVDDHEASLGIVDDGQPSPVAPEAQPLEQIANKELSSFKSLPNEFVQQFLNQATRSVRIANQLRTQQATSLLPPDAKQLVQGEEEKFQQAVPLLLKEREAKGLGGAIGNITGSFADPIVALSSGLGAKTFEMGADKLLVDQAERAAADAALFEAKHQINRASADQAVNTLMKQNLVKGVAAGAGGGGAGGLASGLLDVKDQNLSGNDAILHIMKTTAGGTGAGALFGLAGTQLGSNRALRKQAAQIPESINVVSSPARNEVVAQLDSLALERSKLSSELEATQKLAGPAESQKLQSQLKASYQQAPEQVADQAAQRAALVDELATSKSANIQDTRSQQVARLQSQIDLDQAALETLKIDPRPIEERYAGQQMLEKRIASRQKMQQELGSLVEKEQASLKLERQTHLDEISDNLDARLENLHSERQQLLTKLQSKMAAPEKIEALQANLRQNLEQQARLTDVQRNFGFRGAKNPKSEFAVNQGIEIAQQQYDKVHGHLTQLGSFTPEQIQAVAEAEFKNAIELQGIKTGLYKPAAFGELSNDVERFSKMGSLTGTNVGEVVLKSIFAENQLANSIEPALAQWNATTAELRSRGWTNEQITKSLQYMESTGFNPTAKATKSLTREQWPLDVPPSAEDLGALQSLRSQLNQEHQSAVQSGLLSPDQFVEGYVPLMNKPGAAVQQRSAQGLADPRFAQERVSGKLDPLSHELDADQLFLRYKKQVASSEIYLPVVREGARELVKLRLLGQEPAAQIFEKYLHEVYNLKSGEPLERAFGHSSVNSQVNRLLEAGLPESAISEVYNAASTTMYKNIVATSPKNIVMQYVQPEFLLPAEVGVKQYAAARAKALSSGSRKEVAHLMKYILKGDLPATEELLSTNPNSRIAKALNLSGQVSDSLLLTKPFQIGEKVNRYTALIAGKEKFLNAFKSGGYSEVQRAASGFLPAEQAFIEKAFRQGGTQAGSDAMALIVDRRSNFSYARGDRTEALRTGLGKYLPFTTFYRNIIARYQGDVQNGNYTQLAKRLVAPIAAATFFESLTSKDFGESTLKDQVKRAVSGQTIAPALLGPVKNLIETRDLGKTLKSEALKLTPAQPFVRMYENNKKYGNPFGLRPAARDGWTKKLFK